MTDMKVEESDFPSKNDILKAAVTYVRYDITFGEI